MCPPAAHRHHAGDVDHEGERPDLHQCVERQHAGHAERAGGSQQLELGTELHGVGRERQVRLEPQPGVVAGGQRHGQAFELGEPRRGLEVGVEPAHRQQERRVVAPVEPHRHVTGEGEAGDPGIDERGVDRRLAAVEVDDAEDVHLQADHGMGLVGEDRAQPAEDDQADRGGELDDHARGRS